MEKKLAYFEGINGQLEIFNNKVIITRKGFNNFSLKHTGDKTIPISSIHSVELSEGGVFSNGYLQLGIAGSLEGRHGNWDAVNNENTIMINKSMIGNAKEIKKLLEDLIFNPEKYNKVQENFSVADELKKYKELLDMNVITQEEFNKKKKELLG